MTEDLHQARNTIAEIIPNDVPNEVTSTGKIALSHSSTAAHETPIDKRELESTEDGSRPVH